jgi:hypothetical protein
MGWRFDRWAYRSRQPHDNVHDSVISVKQCFGSVSSGYKTPIAWQCECRWMALISASGAEASVSWQCAWQYEFDVDRLYGLVSSRSETLIVWQCTWAYVKHQAHDNVQDDNENSCLNQCLLNMEHQSRTWQFAWQYEVNENSWMYYCLLYLEHQSHDNVHDNTDVV